VLKRRLSDLRVGEEGIIAEVLNEGLQVKLLEMGCLPGEHVRVHRVAPFGGPMAIDVFGYVLSLRRAEARDVVVESVEAPAPAIG